jgi:hypothetical protein
MQAIPMPPLDAGQQQAIERAITEMQTITVNLRTEHDVAIRNTLTGRLGVLRGNVNTVVAAAYGLGTEDVTAVTGG